MQVDDAAAARPLVQSVHVLGDQQFHMPGMLQCRQVVMGVIGPRIADCRPPQHRPGPVTLACAVVTQEGAMLNGCAMLPGTLAVAVGRQARRLADAGPAQHQEAGTVLQEVSEVFCLRHRCDHVTSIRRLAPADVLIHAQQGSYTLTP